MWEFGRVKKATYQGRLAFDFSIPVGRGSNYNLIFEKFICRSCTMYGFYKVKINARIINVSIRQSRMALAPALTVDLTSPT